MAHRPPTRHLMKRGVARRLISEGEDAFRMLAAVVWPGRDWEEDAFRGGSLLARDVLRRRHAVSAGALDSSAAHATRLLTDDVSVAYG